MTRIDELKQRHIQKVRECFYNQDILIKNQLAQELGISKSLTTNILQVLLENKEINYVGDSESTGGRKSKNYEINKDYYHILEVILIKKSQQHVYVSRCVDLKNNICFEDQFISVNGSIKELIDFILKSLKKDSIIQTIALSIPGVCNEGYIGVCDFEDFQEKNIIQILGEQIDKDIVLENDVNVACVGFSCDYPDVENLAFVYQPEVDYTGIGLVIDHKLYNGFSHFAGEVRYLPFYSHQEQDKLLKENPTLLLKQQLETLCCVLNPQMIGIYSNTKIQHDKLKMLNIPSLHQPNLIFYDEMDELMHNGLYRIGKKSLLEREGRK